MKLPFVTMLIVGMLASLKLIQEIGIEAISERILELRHALIDRIHPLGYELYLDDNNAAPNPGALSGIIAVSHPTRDVKELARKLDENGVSVSLRQNRFGLELIRFSPHFYNTVEEFDRVAELMA